MKFKLLHEIVGPRLVVLAADSTPQFPPMIEHVVSLHPRGGTPGAAEEFYFMRTYFQCSLNVWDLRISYYFIISFQYKVKKNLIVFAYFPLQVLHLKSKVFELQIPVDVIVRVGSVREVCAGHRYSGHWVLDAIVREVAINQQIRQRLVDCLQHLSRSVSESAAKSKDCLIFLCLIDSHDNRLVGRWVDGWAELEFRFLKPFSGFIALINRKETTLWALEGREVITICWVTDTDCVRVFYFSYDTFPSGADCLYLKSMIYILSKYNCN